MVRPCVARGLRRVGGCAVLHQSVFTIVVDAVRASSLIATAVNRCPQASVIAWPSAAGLATATAELRRREAMEVAVGGQLVPKGSEFVDPEALYVQLSDLVRTMPNFDEHGDLSPNTQQWLGRAYVLVAAAGIPGDEITFKASSANLQLSGPREIAAANVRDIVYRAWAVAESRAPASARGAFIAVGDVFAAAAAIGTVLGTAAHEVLIIDPYMDAKALTDFAVLVPEGRTIRLLADRHYVQ